MDRLVLHSLKVMLAGLLDANREFIVFLSCVLLGAWDALQTLIPFGEVNPFHYGPVSGSSLLPVFDYLLQNVLACPLYREELGVAGIVRLGNIEKVLLRTTTMQ